MIAGDETISELGGILYIDTIKGQIDSVLLMISLKTFEKVYGAPSTGWEYTYKTAICKFGILYSYLTKKCNSYKLV